MKILHNIIKLYVLLFIISLSCIPVFASDDMIEEYDFEKFVSNACPNNYGYCGYGFKVNNIGTYFGISILTEYDKSSRICAINIHDNVSQFGFASDKPFTRTYSSGYSGNDNVFINVNSCDLDGVYYSVTSSSSADDTRTYRSNILTFGSEIDARNYILTGQINNAIYVPSAIYSNEIPTPKNLEVYFNRKLESPFNIGDMHSPINIKWEVPEGEDYSDYTLETYIDVNYNKINSLGGIGTKPTVLNTGRVKLYEENALHCQMNISDTCEGWSTLSEKFETSVWGITGNYLDLWIRYVDSGGNYGNWVKVHITPSNSGSVIKFGGTNTTINKGYEEISGEDNTTKVDDSQYGDKYFVSTKDNGFSESVTNLKSQFGDLISFFSSLFSFLPKEVWELLVAFIGAGCLVALFKFIRG